MKSTIWSSRQSSEHCRFLSTSKALAPTMNIRPFVSGELLDRLSEQGLMRLVLDDVVLFLALGFSVQLLYNERAISVIWRHGIVVHCATFVPKVPGSIPAST